MNRIKKAFTLTELIIVVAIIGILMMGVTVYIGGLGERANTIEAQGCAASLWGQMNNYVFNALTSKNLKLNNGTIVSPDQYLIALGGGTQHGTKKCSKQNYDNEGIYCNYLNFVLMSADVPGGSGIYKRYNVRNTCRQNQANIGFYWSGGTTSDIEYIVMNKGFAPRSVSERKVFYLQHTGVGDENKLTEGDIIVVLCPSDECRNGKEVAKYHVDARVQSISFHKCRFYQEDGITCDTRED